MGIWGRLFKRGRDVETVIDRLMVQAAERAQKPVGPRKSAEWGEGIRGELIDIIESVEAKSGAYAYALAGEDQTLMVSDALRVPIKSHRMGAYWITPLVYCMQRDQQKKIL